MIRVTVTDDGQLLDALQFDDVNVLHHHGRVAMIHRDVMQSCRSNGIWYRVAHAAGIVAERGSLLDAMEAMTKEAIQRLLERLETGWQPKADEIDPVPQFTFATWDFLPSRHASRPRMRLWGALVGVDPDEGWMTRDVLWIDAGLRWALCDDGFYWLHEGPSCV